MMGNNPSAESFRPRDEIEGYLDAAAAGTSGEGRPSSSPKLGDKVVESKSKRKRARKNRKKKNKGRRHYKKPVQHQSNEGSEDEVDLIDTAAGLSHDDLESVFANDGSDIRERNQNGPGEAVEEELERVIEGKYGDYDNKNSSSGNGPSGSTISKRLVSAAVSTEEKKNRLSLKDIVSHSAKFSRVATDPDQIPGQAFERTGHVERVLFPSSSSSVAHTLSAEEHGEQAGSAALRTPEKKNANKTKPGPAFVPSSDLLNSKLLHSKSKRSRDRERPIDVTPTKLAHIRLHNRLPASSPIKAAATTAAGGGQQEQQQPQQLDQPFGHLSMADDNSLGEFELTMLKHLLATPALASQAQAGSLAGGASVGTLSSTAAATATGAVPRNFGMTLEANGVVGLTNTVPGNADTIMTALLRPRRSDPQVTQAEHEAYIKAIATTGVTSDATAKSYFVNHVLDLGSSICATLFDVELNLYAASGGGGLSANLPVPAPGMLQGILASDFEMYVDESVRRAAGPAAAPCGDITLAHVVGDWKKKGESAAMLELRHLYHGAILAEGHDSAVRCSGVVGGADVATMMKSVEPSVLGFTTDGHVLDIYVHFSVPVEVDRYGAGSIDINAGAAAGDENAAGEEEITFSNKVVEYRAFRLKQIRLTRTLAEFSMGRNVVRNLQAWGGVRSQNLRDLLAGVNASHMMLPSQASSPVRGGVQASSASFFAVKGTGVVDGVLAEPEDKGRKVIVGGGGRRGEDAAVAGAGADTNTGRKKKKGNHKNKKRGGGGGGGGGKKRSHEEEQGSMSTPTFKRIKTGGGGGDAGAPPSSDASHSSWVWTANLAEE